LHQTTRYCARCQAQRPFTTEKKPPFHMFHFSLTLALCGLWLPVWLYLSLAFAAAPATCNECGWRRE
jgi:hypothetical protein